MPDRFRLASTVVLAGLLASGCCPRPPADAGPATLSTQPTTAPADTGPLFTDPATGVSLRPPPGWVRLPTPDYVLVATPAAGGPPEISLDIPKLPPHVPGWIPIGMVRNGYVDDVAAAHPGAKSVDLDPPKLPGANARLVRSDWTEGGTGFTELAILIVRGDRVYIVRHRGRTADFATDRARFDAVVASLAWPK